MVEAVDPGRADEVQALGWVPASAEQAKDHFLREKYGSTGQAALAGLEAFGSVATFGASTWLEKAAGVDPEGIRAREEFNPLAEKVGTGAGILVPLLMTGGASAAAKVVVCHGSPFAPSCRTRCGPWSRRNRTGAAPAAGSSSQPTTSISDPIHV